MLYRQLSAALAVCAAVGCGPTGGEGPAFVGLEDQVGFVGTEMFFEVRATDPELSALTFAMLSTAPTASGATLVPAGNGNGSSALFRWTPEADDIGIWIFDFVASDGVNETTESIAIEVRSIDGGAPVFRQPLGAGTTLDLTSTDCLSLSITVEDPDSADVQITQEAPVIDGASLSDTPEGLVWDWCPSSEQIASGDSFVLSLAADDGEHLTMKHFVIVLRNVPVVAPLDLGGFTVHQAGSTCAFELPAPLEIDHGTTVIIARDATRAEFETFWGVELPASSVFINSGDTCPLLNGDESFTLTDSSGTVADGPTPLIFEHENMRRLKGALPGGEVASWNFGDVDVVGANPGVSPADPDANIVYLSEISDVRGTGNFVFEFVEIAVD